MGTSFYLFSLIWQHPSAEARRTLIETQVKRVYQRISLSEMMASAEDVEVF
jgi:hypothetical protein